MMHSDYSLSFFKFRNPAPSSHILRCITDFWKKTSVCYKNFWFNLKESQKSLHLRIVCSVFFIVLAPVFWQEEKLRGEQQDPLRWIKIIFDLEWFPWECSIFFPERWLKVLQYSSFLLNIVKSLFETSDCFSFSDCVLWLGSSFWLKDIWLNS